METLTIDLEMLAIAFEDASYERSDYLDRETGEVLIHSDEMPLEEMPHADQGTAEELGSRALGCAANLLGSRSDFSNTL